MYSVVFTGQASKDAKKIEQAGFKNKVIALIKIIKENPFQNPPPYEKLQGFQDVYSRRINIQHRLVYQVLDEGKHIKIIRMWTHYDKI